MKHLSYISAIFFVFLTLGFAYSLDFVSPSSYDGKSVNLYPGLGTTVSFLKVESGTQVFVDSIDCIGVSCGVLRIVGPYYFLDILPTDANTGQVIVNYHLKGQATDKNNVLNIVNSKEVLTALVIIPTEAQFYEKTQATVVLVNNSDLVLSGKLSTNFPEDVFPPVEFSLDPKTKKEYKTYFYPKNPGYYDISYYLSVDGTDSSQKVGSHTIKINRSLKDFLSLPNKSFFPTNPILTIYSSIVYFVSLLA